MESSSKAITIILVVRKNYRLIYTLITRDEGICPHVIEVMFHPEYLRRFGYKE
jgi:hypothetical protein